jgi:hypothetical protein
VTVDLLKKLASFFTPEGKRDAYTHWVYVQCDRCGERLRTRIDLRNDLSVQYGATERDTTYFCRKTLLGGGRCFQQIEVELTFDAHRQLVERRVRGGKFVGGEEELDQVVE